MKLVEMTNILNVTKAIPVREVNGFDEYEKVFSEIPIEEDGIYLFCAGMMAKVLIADLMRINPNATYLDCGSAFDPLAGRSRTFQITREEFLALYTEPDPKKKKPIPWDNLKIPRRTIRKNCSSWIISTIPILISWTWDVERIKRWTAPSGWIFGRSRIFRGISDPW